MAYEAYMLDVLNSKLECPKWNGRSMLDVWWKKTEGRCASKR